MWRSVAWRIFAEEFNSSKCYLEPDKKQAAGYLITPTGAKANRIFISGVLINTEELGKGLVRGKVSDPTGVFSIYAGKYQPKIRDKLIELDVPNYISITGKTRVYRPDEESIIPSIHTEDIRIINEETRIDWIIITAKRTIQRIKVIKKGKNMNKDKENLAKYLIKNEVNKDLAKGASNAIKFYNHDLEDLKDIVRNGLKPLTKNYNGGETPKDAVRRAISTFDGGDGAQYSKILEEASKEKFSEEIIEKALNDLLEEGKCYEPNPGKIKIV